jgi:Kef-type K+ transport system membrane component KefB
MIARVGHWIDTHRAPLSASPIILALFLFEVIADRPGGGSAVLGAFLLGAFAPGYIKYCARLDAETRRSKEDR